jgi:hypothetical protein
MSYPRRHSALTGQSETTSSTLPDYRDYDAIAEHCWNLKQPYKFKVVKDGSYYRVYNKYGNLTASPTSFATALNSEVFANLTSSRTWMDKVIIEGACSVDDKITVPSLVEIEIQGVLTAANALNKDMFENANQATNNYGIYIHGGEIDGNGANQSAGTGKVLDFVNATNVPVSLGTDSWYPSALYLSDITINNPNARSSAVNINFTGSAGSTLKWRNVQVQGWDYNDSGYTVVLTAINDSDIVESFIGGKAKALYASGSSCNLDFSYFNGCATLYGWHKSRFSARYLDNSQNEHSITMQYCKRSSVYNTFFHRVNSNGYTTKHGIYLYGAGGFNTYECQFSNLHFGRAGDGGTNKDDYGIYENDADQDLNQYVNINGLDCTSGALRLAGATSKGQHQNIMGTVTEV